MYQNLKRRLKLLIRENENYQEELRKCQKELLIINRDKYFLMDKLMKYEKLSSSDDDSEVTDSSESEKEVKQERSTSKTRRRRLDSTIDDKIGTTSNVNTSTTTKRKRVTNNGTATTKLPPPSSSSSSSPSLITYSSYRNRKSNSGPKAKGMNKPPTTIISVSTSTSLTPLKSTSSFSCSPTVTGKTKSPSVPPPTVPSILSATLTAATITASLPTMTPTTVGFNSSPLKVALSQPITNSSLTLAPNLNSSSSSSSTLVSTPSSSSSHINHVVNTQHSNIQSSSSSSTNQHQPLPPSSVSLSITSSPLIPSLLTVTPTIALPRLSTLKTEPSPSILSLGRGNGGQLTSEEIERHLESRSIQQSLLLPEKAPLTVPIELFSNESPNESTTSEMKLE